MLSFIHLSSPSLRLLEPVFSAPSSLGSFADFPNGMGPLPLSTPRVAGVPLFPEFDCTLPTVDQEFQSNVPVPQEFMKVGMEVPELFHYLKKPKETDAFADLVHSAMIRLSRLTSASSLCFGLELYQRGYSGYLLLIRHCARQANTLLIRSEGKSEGRGTN